VDAQSAYTTQAEKKSESEELRVAPPQSALPCEK
jgi:hypothetical protein